MNTTEEYLLDVMGSNTKTVSEADQLKELITILDRKTADLDIRKKEAEEAEKKLRKTAALTISVNRTNILMGPLLALTIHMHPEQFKEVAYEGQSEFGSVDNYLHLVAQETAKKVFVALKYYIVENP